MEKRSKLLEPFVEETRLSRINEVLSNRIDSLALVLEDVRNPHNVAAVLRSADAFGISRVFLLGGEFSYNPSVSLGTEKWLEVEKSENAESLCKRLDNEGFSIVTMQPEEDSRVEVSREKVVPKVPVMQLPFEQKLALVFGNEHKGVSDTLASRSAYHAFIPMYGFVESFNISVACAITLFCSTIGRSKAERRGLLVDNERSEALKTQWLSSSVRAGEAILRRLEETDE